MQGQISKQIKHERLTKLSQVECATRLELLQKEISERAVCEVLFETFENGRAIGHTANFIEVSVPSEIPLHSITKKVRLLSNDNNICFGEIID